MSSPLPSDEVIRSNLRTILSASDMSKLTPKIVRTQIAEQLNITDDGSLDELKKKLKEMLQVEIDRITAEGKAANKASSSPSEKKRKDNDQESEQPTKKLKKDSKSSKESAPDEVDIDALAAEAEKDDDSEAEDEMTQEEKDAAFAASLAAEGRRPRRAAAPVSKPARKPSKARKPADPNAPKKMSAISPALAEFFGGGVSEMNRGEVVKQIWVYIKKENLQDPSDKRKIILDEKMKGVFGEKKRIDMFQMAKLLQPHIKNKHQLAD